jgi:hypothetical protein
MRDVDLRRAEARGWILWAVEGLGSVELVDGYLRYDPALSSRVRGRLVLDLLRRSQT